MKWLLSLFNKNTKIEESNSEDSYTINMQIFSESEFNGINPYLISILYFPNEIEKEKFANFYFKMKISFKKINSLQIFAISMGFVTR